MKDFIKIQYAKVCVRFSYSELDKKEVLKRYLKRYHSIDISRECINSRVKQS
jgi:hypothetical protein